MSFDMIKDLKSEIRPYVEALEKHSLYSKIKTKKQLAFFMESHVFAVLDFMSLLRSLRTSLIPNNRFWTPPVAPRAARFINEIFLGEESDLGPDGMPCSHFELYLSSMKEIGAQTEVIEEFIHVVQEFGINYALKKVDIPMSSALFTKKTFMLIEENVPHKLAASFCFGREKVIPQMFKVVLEKIGVTRKEAPLFYYYIERHIEVDSEDHGPMAENLINILCGNHFEKWRESSECAIECLKDRIHFWDNIQKDLLNKDLIFSQNQIEYEKLFDNFKN